MHFLNLLLHIDLHLRSIVAAYGLMVYVLLFVLVATPFVSGDALLFAGGTLAGMGMLDYPLLCAVLLCATVIGDSAGFFIGAAMGPGLFQHDRRWFKREHLDQAHAFYEKHGGAAIILARFVPVVRIFAPVAAGVAGMGRGRVALGRDIGNGRLFSRE
jgi:membrane-associated protein